MYFVILAICCASFVAVVAYICSNSFSSGKHVTAINKKKFYVLLFPSLTTLYDTKGNPHLVDRAAIASLEEIDSDLFCMVLDGREYQFNRSMFVYLSDKSAEKELLANLNKEILNWKGETDWRSVSFDIRHTRSEELTCVLEITLKSGRAIEYTYVVDSKGRLIPRYTKID